jgi:hypothetical protein
MGLPLRRGPADKSVARGTGPSGGPKEQTTHGTILTIQGQVAQGVTHAGFEAEMSAPKWNWMKANDINVDILFCRFCSLLFSM